MHKINYVLRIKWMTYLYLCVCIKYLDCKRWHTNNAHEIKLYSVFILQYSFFVAVKYLQSDQTRQRTSSKMSLLIRIKLRTLDRHAKSILLHYSFEVLFYFSILICSSFLMSFCLFGINMNTIYTLSVLNID